MVRLRDHRALQAGLSLVWCAHLALVWSILRQPMFTSTEWPKHKAPQRSVLWPLYNDMVHRGAGPGADFLAVYHAGVNLGRGQDPYNDDEVPRVTPDFFSYRYLPIFALTLGRVAAACDPKAAYVGWIVVLELLLAFCIVRLWLEELGLGWKTLAVVSLLLSSPYFLEVHMGQFSFATLALVCTAALSLDDQKRSLPGAALAYTGAVLMKIYPLAALPAFLRSRRGIVAGVVAIVLSLGLNAGYFVNHPEQFSLFAKLNLGDTGNVGADSGNHGFAYVLYTVLDRLNLLSPTAPGFSRVSSLLQLLFLGTTTGLILWRKPTILTGTIALMLAHMSSYKHVWEHHASATVVCAVFLLLRLGDERARRARWVVAACLGLLVVPTCFVFFDAQDVSVWDPTNSWPVYARYLAPSLKALPTVVLWGVGVTWVFREAQHPRGPGSDAAPVPA